MRIGVYGSSFNPVTNGHLWSANTIAEREGLDKVLFLPSSAQRRDKSITISDEHRLAMLKLAIAGNERFAVNECELHAPPGRHYTYDTMRLLRAQYPQDELFFLLGADLLKDLPAWSQAEKLLSETRFIVIERGNIPMQEVIGSHELLRRYEQHFTVIYKGLINEISSSYIRGEFAAGRDPRYLLPEAVYQYIKEYQVYLLPKQK